MTKKIIELLLKLPKAIQADLGLYVGLGLTAVVFLIALIAGLVSGGALKKGKCKAAVLAEYKARAVSRMAVATAVGAVAAAAVGVGLSMVYNGTTLFTSAEGIIIACTAVLGGILSSVSAIVSSAVLKGALKKCPDKHAHESANENPAPRPVYEQPKHMYEQPQTANESVGADAYSAPVYNSVKEEQPVYEQPEPQAEQPAYEQPTYEPPVYEQPAYEQPVYEQPEQAEPAYESRVEEQPVYEQPETDEMQKEAEEKARAREQAIAALKAEQEARARENAENEAAKAAAQLRLEELRAQRGAQVKAQREAAARANAEAAANARPSVSTEDVIEQIEKIDRDGATLPVMREVAMLLRKERAKPENQTPEQQKKLNEALAKLLKAMSAANKR